MSYTKHNYKKGDELLASQLNEMDDQIALNEQTADTLVTVSNTQPAAAKNRVWVKATPSEIEIPTMDDLDEVNRQLSNHADALTSVVRKEPVNLLDIFEIEDGVYYEWNTGIKKTNAAFVAIKVPLTQYKQVVWTFEIAATSLHLTRWYNGQYVSGLSTASAHSPYTVSVSSDIDMVIFSIIKTRVSESKIYYPYSVVREFDVYAGDSLKDVINEATQSYGSIVRVHTGTYDIIEEFGGTEAIDAGDLSLFDVGILLCNGIHLLFSTGAKVICHYTGTNTTFLTRFSPFTANNSTNSVINGDFEIVGLDLDASRCKYGLHDDLGFSTTEMYHHIYKDCHIKFDNSNNSAWNAEQCIGGGLGDFGLIDIENCIFETVATREEVNDVSYHANTKNTVANTKSNVFIKDSWFSHTFSARYYNTFTTISNFYMSNCSVASLPYVRAETSSSTVVNVALEQWNNVVRN